MDCITITPQTQNPCSYQPSKPEETDVSEGDAAKKKLKLPNKGKGRTRFIGVRQRPSGRWVAEIKDSSQKLRLWLGTFDRPEEAAMAYDSAARLLRGRNARTNFQVNEVNKTHQGKFSLIAKNSKFYQLFHHALMKNHAKSPSTNSQCSRKLQKEADESSNSFDFISSVEETIVCSSQSSLSLSQDGGFGYVGFQEGDGLCGVSLGCSKVYSSVQVAPSFSASVCTGEGNEEMRYEENQSHEPLFLHASGLLENGFV
ncbi:uncharacterized protein LOC143878243 [Tasmannia lanceolata]|uniref:uncharacterized protein LOC143878243 n=1 Tax=Tasmannia lanceolata TaxID=3420 RepID=UPI0040628894